MIQKINKDLITLKEQQQYYVKPDELERVKKEYDTLKGKQTQLQKSLDENKQILANNKQVKNTLIIDENYKKALKEYSNNQTTNHSNAITEAAKSLISKNTYNPSPADQAVKVNIHKLSKEVIDELAAYTSTLANDIRHQIGTNRSIASAQMQAVTQQLIKYYNDDNWDAFDSGKGHHTEALKQIANEANLNGYAEEMGSSIYNPYFSMYYPGGEDNINTLDFLKYCIYDTMKNMLFDDASSQWGHAFGLTGINEEKSNANNPSLIGLGIDKYGNTHFFIADDHANTDSKITDQQKPLKETMVELNTVALKNKVDEQENDLKTLNTTLVATQTNYQSLSEKDKQYKELEKQINELDINKQHSWNCYMNLNHFFSIKY